MPFGSNIRYVTFLLCAALTGWIGCDADDPTGPAIGRPENLGRAVTASGEVSHQSLLAWSPDGDEVFFIGHRSGDLKAVRVSDGAIRTVSSSPTPFTVNFFVARDGQWIFRTRWATDRADGGLLLDRVPAGGGTPEILAENVTGYLFAAWAPPAVSPSGELLAYAAVGERGDPNDARIGTRDTLYLYDIGLAERTAIGFGVPLAFSPDGTRLAFDEKPCNEGGLWSNPCDTYVMHLGTGATEHIPWDKDDIGKQVWWDESGIRSLASTSDFDTSTLQWIVRNLTLGTVQVAYSLTRGQEFPHPPRPVHSPDGTRVAGWTVHFEDQFEGLHVVDLRTSRSWLAVVNRTAEGWNLAFSPDGTRLAYVIGTRIFAQDL